MNDLDTFFSGAKDVIRREQMSLAPVRRYGAEGSWVLEYNLTSPRGIKLKLWYDTYTAMLQIYISPNTFSSRTNAHQMMPHGIISRDSRDPGAPTFNLFQDRVGPKKEAVRRFKELEKWLLHYRQTEQAIGLAYLDLPVLQQMEISEWTAAAENRELDEDRTTRPQEWELFKKVKRTFLDTL